ncbi:MAG: DUF1599 domain-containing protein [Flavobacteriales bacterium]|nr:DUF1599 domain-containing protein [Flavobacteriales bacterium]
MSNTSDQYDSIIENCRDIFMKKMKDYGTSWRILRLSSITDQVFIKANRVRTLQETGVSKVGEGILPEFMAIVNYSIMAQIQIEIGTAKVEHAEMKSNQVEVLYDKYATLAKELMEAKNHDYGEAWRDMRISSLTDLILVKLLRIKQIEDNKGETIVSEGIDSNYYDILNYSVFALIKMKGRES